MYNSSIDANSMSASVTASAVLYCWSRISLCLSITEKPKEHGQ